MATQIVKGTRDFDSTVKNLSQAMNNAWMLYIQDQFTVALPNHLYYMSRWQYFEGGTYTIRFACDDTGAMYIDNEPVIPNANIGQSTYPYIVIANGWHRLDVSYYNVPANSPGYAGWAFYKDGNVQAESISTPEGMFGDDAQWPDIGTKPSGSGSNILSLPVFVPEPNWENAVVETWAWLTTVNTSETGAEQRRKIRRYPRRFIEADFRGFRGKRRILDMAITGLGKGQCLIPLWFDTQLVRKSYKEGDAEIEGDFDYRNFYAGGVAIIRPANRDNPFEYELVPILEVHDDKLVLAQGLKSDWSNFRLLPARIAVIEDAVSFDNHSNSAADATVRFRIITAETFIQPSWVFGGKAWPRNGRDNLPVINKRPNWRENLQHSFDRVVYWTDNQTGVPFVMDAGNQETVDWSLPWLLHGKREKFEFMQMLFAMAGQTQPFYAPNWMEDFEVAQDIFASTGLIAVQQTGYSYYADLLQEVKRSLYIELKDGTVHICRIVSTRVERGWELLYLDQAIGNVAKDDIRVICFMPYCRLGSDTVEIQHHTDLSGPAESTLALHGFIERRDGTPAIFP